MISEELKGEMFLKYGKELKKGEVLFKENDEATEVYIVISGNVKISKHITSGDRTYEKILNNVSEGEILGEMGLFRENSKRTASAYISEDTKILVIDKNTFFAMIRYNAEFSIKLMERLSYYVIKNNKEIEELSLYQKRLLIIEYILEKVEKTNSNTISVDSILKDSEVNKVIGVEDVYGILEKIAKTDSIRLDDSNNVIVNSKQDLKKMVTILSDVF